MVDLVPNSITTSTSRGVGWPADTNWKSTSGSRQRIAAVVTRQARQHRRGDLHRSAPAARPAGGSDAASSAGKRSAAGSHGITPKQASRCAAR